jgi:hypothetical protein
MAELVYEVSFKGTASETRRAAFDDCSVRTGRGVTLVRCPPILVRAVFDRIQSLGLDLFDVRLVAETSTGER